MVLLRLRLQRFPESVLYSVREVFGYPENVIRVLGTCQDPIVDTPFKQVKQPLESTITEKTYQSIPYKEKLIIVGINLDKQRKKTKMWRKFGVEFVGTLDNDIDYVVVRDNVFNKKTRNRFKKRYNLVAVSESEFMKVLENR